MADWMLKGEQGDLEVRVADMYLKLNHVIMSACEKTGPLPAEGLKGWTTTQIKTRLHSLGILERMLFGAPAEMAKHVVKVKSERHALLAERARRAHTKEQSR